MGFGTNKELKILLISSGMPKDNSPKMAFDMANALATGKHKVDLLLKYPIKHDTVNTIAVFSESDIFKHRIYNGLKRRFLILRSKLLPVKKRPLPNYYFFNTDEEHPPVKSSLILRKIQVNYDLVLVFFWQGMLTSKSILDIYKKLNVPIFLIAADLFPMTGGCSYFWDCRNFENSCGKCPALLSTDENDFTRKIFLYKKGVYEKINSVFLSNSWVTKHAKNSKLFKHVDSIFPVIDEDIFKPYDKHQVKLQYNIVDKLVLFIGSVNVNEERKGFDYLVKSLHILAQKAPELLKKVVLVIAGGSTLDLQPHFDFEVIKTGQLSFEQLAKHYAMADIYLSSTIQDAGPMMVNQALMCGTPVVAFEIGTACDVVNNDTGYLAQYKDANDFCNGILNILMLSKEEKDSLSKRCRFMGLNTSSYGAFEKQISKVYHQLQTG